MSSSDTVVFVLGGPGSGKGTQCAKIVEKYGWAHFSAGDLLRAEVARGSEQGQLLQDIMNEGGIVPFEITLGLIQAAMNASEVKNFLIDGFPRALDQASAFEANVVPAAAMLFFNCSEATMESRLLNRGEGRSDDTPETIKKRFRVYQETTMPVIDRFRQNGRLREIGAERSPDEVFADVQNVIEELEANAPAQESPVAPAADSGGNLIDFGTDPTEPPETAPEPAQASESATDDTAVSAAPVVIVGPSGVGKGTLIDKLMKQFGSKFGFTVSHTTREPRAGEVEGQHYYFTTQEDMQAAINDGQFVEYAHVHGNIYGTSNKAIEEVARQGKVAVLDIDVQGARLVRKSKYGKSALFVFIAPPSMEELERRLRGRATESEDKILKRLENAKGEVEASEEPGVFDQVVVNTDIQTAFNELLAAIAAHSPGCIPAQDATAAQDAPLAGRSRARDYLTEHLVPHFRSAMLAVNEARPEDPLQYVIDYLIDLKAKLGATG